MSKNEEPIGLVVRFLLSSQEAHVIGECASIAGVETLFRKGWSYAELMMERYEAEGAPHLDQSMEEFAERFVALVAELGLERLVTIERAEVSIALFPNDSINASLYIPTAMLNAMGSHKIDLLFSAY
ncbi:hypothetical protein DEU34_1436 [Microbacterium sp. AG1240]|uniref:hypothetical protein n=1 Tax=Microbacterium sp. AG1240 TaxID=2183992 RepID=UPI000F2694DA|nr:hypothetical protein [Microbacterium sp. AG1240]RKT36906.1 hypothetical protein DEU34_1436 [Microbacterium sp. AG1240]